MVTRRKALGAAAALWAHSRIGWSKSPHTCTPVDFAIPAEACDCHTHIFGDPAKFPLWPGRAYTPEVALLDEMEELHKTLHMERVVIVTPSVYGTDNAATIDGMKARGPSARGVVVIDARTPEPALDAMNRAGVRGVRLNLVNADIDDPSVARHLVRMTAARVRRLNWHVQIYTIPAVIDGLRDVVMTSPVPIVFDHFGGAVAARGVQQPGFLELVDLVRLGKAYVKLSAVYRVSKRPDYADAAPLARALIAANPEQVLWGSDWPHPDTAVVTGRKPTDIAPLLQVDDGKILNLLPTWAHDAGVRRKILVENPARLYGF